MEVNNLRTNRRAQIGNITIPLLKGDKGDKGDTGYSISRIERTSGDGTPGTTDTYTIYINTTPESVLGTFTVTNGLSGDMLKSVYDTTDAGMVDKSIGDKNGDDITTTYATKTENSATDSKIGTLTNLTTTDKDSVVDAINEVVTYLSGKVDTVEGKELSENDFTDTLKSKLDNIEAEANKTVVDSYFNNSSTNPVQNKVIYASLNSRLNVQAVQNIDSSGSNKVYSCDYLNNKFSNYYTKTEIDTLVGDIESLLASI